MITTVTMTIATNGNPNYFIQLHFLYVIEILTDMFFWATASKETLPPSKDILKGILKKIPKSNRFKSKDWDTTSRGRIKVTLGVPFVYRQYQQKRAGFRKAA